MDEDLTGLHVLVVDDDRDTRDVFRLALRMCGAIVSLARSATEALYLLQERTPDVLVSDISMPDHDGYWLVREVRELPDEAGGLVPAIAVTGHASEHNRRRALDAGFQGYVPKPVDPHTLCRKVACLTGRAEAPAD